MSPVDEMGFRILGEDLLGRDITLRRVLGKSGGAKDTTAPTVTITAGSAVANVVAMTITFSEAVTGFLVGDITISGGSLASFATADNIVFTADWTLAAGANTMDIATGVCTDAAGNNNTAATQFSITYLTLQPDETAANDTFINNFADTTNYATNGALRVGRSGAYTYRALVKFDLSSIPAGSTVLSAILSLYAITDNSTNAVAFKVHRPLRAWVEDQATWQIYSTGNSWQTAGGFGALDCEQAAIGSRNFTDTETLNQFKAWTLTASAIQAMITGGAFINNGFLVKTETEASDNHYQFASASNATAGNRPKFEIVYRP
jgi:hypothetical protein